MEGVRDCAQEYDIQMQVLYGAAWTQQQWKKTIQEEQTLGSKGILLLYPERFLSVSRTDEQTYAAMPACVVPMSRTRAFRFRRRLTAQMCSRMMWFPTAN